MVAGADRFHYTLDVGADHAALAGFQDATVLGLAGALASLLAVRHRVSPWRIKVADKTATKLNMCSSATLS